MFLRSNRSFCGLIGARGLMVCLYIFGASGKPTRAELKDRKRGKKKKGALPTDAWRKTWILPPSPAQATSFPYPDSLPCTLDMCLLSSTALDATLQESETVVGLFAPFLKRYRVSLPSLVLQAKIAASVTRVTNRSSRKAS